MASSISRRRLLHGVVATATLARAWPARAQVADAGRSAMAAAATSFLATLDARQRGRVVFQFGDAERVNWHYIPRRRAGLTFKDMAAPSRAAAHELMKASLSAVGYAKAVNIIQLEEVLRQIEMLGLTRDPENYAFTIFGTPGESAAWGWRLEGRRELFTSRQGVPLGAMSGDQRALATRLIETYARNMRTEIAEEELRRMRDAGLEQVHFAWAGPIDPARPHYYRVHGPTLVIEYDNTQNDANHIHSVWHDPVNDFGADLLRAHYEHGHHHA